MLLLLLLLETLAQMLLLLLLDDVTAVGNPVSNALIMLLLHMLAISLLLLDMRVLALLKYISFRCRALIFTAENS